MSSSEFPGTDSRGHSSPLLQMTDISKRFGDKVALERITLEVAPGEVHAICGENGAGKSTLMNILSGIHQPDGGQIKIHGKTVELSDAAAATRLGIGMVHQHFTLVPSMTVAENIFLGNQPRRWGFLSDKRAMLQSAKELIDKFGFRLDASARIGDLTVGERQRAEIVKALAFDAEILILDEPTAVLTPPEVDELIEIVSGLRDRGRTILFITHKLREVKALSDRVTVLRRGVSVGTHLTSAVSTEDIAQEMVGRSVFLTEKRDSHPADPAVVAPILQAIDLSHESSSGRMTLDGVSFDLRPGEILGIAGVEGNGQTELAEVLTGLRKAHSGQIILNGAEVTAVGPIKLRKSGVAHIPEDRLDRGLSRLMSVAENLSASNYNRPGLVRGGMISKRALDEWADECIAEYDIRGATPDTHVGDLSGGNMQKVVIARELARAPEVLIVAQPTRGVDIGASEFVHNRILAAADRGCAVLLISSELSEVIGLSDRIGVMFQGSLIELPADEPPTEERIGLLMNTGSLEVGA